MKWLVLFRNRTASLNDTLTDGRPQFVEKSINSRHKLEPVLNGVKIPSRVRDCHTFSRNLQIFHPQLNSRIYTWHSALCFSKYYSAMIIIVLHHSITHFKNTGVVYPKYLFTLPSFFEPYFWRKVSAPFESTIDQYNLISFNINDHANSNQLVGDTTGGNVCIQSNNKGTKQTIPTCP